MLRPTRSPLKAQSTSELAVGAVPEIGRRSGGPRLSNGNLGNTARACPRCCLTESVDHHCGLPHAQGGNALPMTLSPIQEEFEDSPGPWEVGLVALVPARLTAGTPLI